MPNIGENTPKKNRIQPNHQKTSSNQKKYPQQQHRNRNPPNMSTKSVKKNRTQNHEIKRSIEEIKNQLRKSRNQTKIRTA